MATRFYLPSTGTPAISPAFDSYWTYTSSTFIHRRPLVLAKDGSALTAGDTAAGSGSPKGKRLQTQYIYELPQAMSFSGTATLAVAGFEGNAADNAGLQCLLRVVDAAGTTIGTLFTGDLSSTVDTAREFIVAAQAAATVKVMEMTLTPVDAPAGSYLVAEIGVLQGYVGISGTRIGRIILGAPSATDHTGIQGEATATNAPWLEFSQNLLPVQANLTGSGVLSATTLAKVPVAAPLVAAAGVFSAVVTGGDPPPAVSPLLEGSGAFTAVHDRVAWLRARIAEGTTGWTARRRWSTFGSEVDTAVLFQDGTLPGSIHGPLLSASHGGDGYNRMYRLIHTGTLSLAGATQLHVTWFFGGGDGYGDGGPVIKLILDGVTYSVASQVNVPVGDGGGYVHRTTFNINPTASVNTVAVQWENNDDPIWAVFLDEIDRTPRAATALQRTASLTGSGQFTATTHVVGGPVGAVLAGTGAFTATVLTGGVKQASAFATGSGAFTAIVRERPSGHIFGDVQTATGSVLDGTPAVPRPSYLLIVDSELEETPSVLDVRVANVEPLAEVTFAIDGVDVGTETADVQGDILALSLDVTRGVGAGSHTLTATTAGTASEATFTVASAPSSLPPTQNPDLPPVLVDGSTGDNGVYRWVLQDLTPGGIGSWVMPINPSSMANPHVRKTVAATSTTAVHGQPHVSEGATPVEWEFAGFAPDQAFQDKLLAYAGLRYRFYLIDHRNRAWIVSFASVDLVPRKRKHNDLGQPTDWMADYSVRAVLYSQTPQEVTP